MPRPAAVPPSLGPHTRRDSVDQQALTLERRLEDLLDTVGTFVSFRFNVRAPVGPDGDFVDAIAGGVNFLGEELEASFNEVERRVADRTGELATATQELSRRVLHDELTGLPNRSLFREHLSHRMATEGRRQAGFAVPLRGGVGGTSGPPQSGPARPGSGARRARRCRLVGIRGYRPVPHLHRLRPARAALALALVLLGLLLAADPLAATATA